MYLSTEFKIKDVVLKCDAGKYDCYNALIIDFHGPSGCAAHSYVYIDDDGEIQYENILPVKHEREHYYWCEWREIVENSDKEEN